LAIFDNQPALADACGLSGGVGNQKDGRPDAGAFRYQRFGCRRSLLSRLVLR
jgi:hypothetical protein